VRSHLRRAALSATASGDAKLDLGGGVTIDLARRSVTRDGAPVHLTPIEWDLVRVLASNAGRTMTHAQLYARVWDRPHGDAQQNLRVHVASVRRKLERDPVRPAIIITEPGVGYRLETAR
jgi:two-component system KDP operon response regulator KdpE